MQQENSKNSEQEDSNISEEQNIIFNEESKNNEVEDLNQKISDLEIVVEDLNKKLLLKTADAENLRRRHKEEIEKSNKYAISNFASDITIVSEQLFLAEENMPKEEISKNEKIQNFTDAVIMTKNELLKTLEKYQINRIYPLNQKFDHHLHEAISRIEDEGEENIVKQVVQAGYKISDRLIKSALVTVSTKKQ
jgi:molecular chaperone GrpE